jgi:hypothetical protein
MLDQRPAESQGYRQPQGVRGSLHPLHGAVWEDRGPCCSNFAGLPAPPQLGAMEAAGVPHLDRWNSLSTGRGALAPRQEGHVAFCIQLRVSSCHP